MTKTPSREELLGQLQKAEYITTALQAKLNLKIEQEDPTAIRIPDRLRAVDPAKVKQLAASMDAIGLQQPVTVWMPKDGELELVAGAHRVQAACDLNWDYIDCIFADDMTEAERRLWEVDENLIRAELSPTERGEHLTRRAEIWSALEADGASCATCLSDGRAAGPQHKKGFAAATAVVTGLSKAAINRDLARTRAIIQDLRDKIKGTRLDTATYLDTIKTLEPEAQRLRVVHDLVEPPPKKFKVKIADAPISEPSAADIKAAGKVAKKATQTISDLFPPLKAVKQAWHRASAEDRRRIKAWVADQETPASDDGDGDA